MEDEKDHADIPCLTGFDPSGSCSGFKLSAKLRARMEKLENWRILPSSIKSLEDARQFHGGHATVSTALLLRDDDDPREALRQYAGSRGHIRAETGQPVVVRLPGVVRQRSVVVGQRGVVGQSVVVVNQPVVVTRPGVVAVKKSRIGDNKDLERVLGLALREAEFLVELDHENIVELKGFVEDLSKDVIWLVFSWADNGNLKDFVASRDWEIPERISLINDVAGGLEYLHNRDPPICHGDLKSFNVLVNSYYRAVITDFGSARRLTEHDLNRQPGPVQNQQQSLLAKFSTLSNTITLTGNLYTLRWAAPELLNEDQMSLWSDIWALGWIAYEVLTDSIPFQDVQADISVVERVIKGDLPSINGHDRVSVFEKLCSLMMWCWRSNPSERPTAKDCLNDIRYLPRVVPNPLERLDPSTDSSRTLMERGRGARESGDLALAFACFTEAHRIFTKLDDRKGTAHALDSLAELHVDRKEYSKAIKLYSEALQTHPDIDDLKRRASALRGLAEVHGLRSEYNETIALRSGGLQTRTDIEEKRSRADALWSLAEAHRLLNEYSEAIAHYSEALQIRTDICDRAGQVSALSSLAEVHRLRKEYSEAITLYSEALQIRTDVGDRTGQASTLSSLAQVHQLRKEYREAIKLYSEALQIRPDVDDSLGKASALLGLAGVCRLRKEYSEAIKLFSEALQIRTDVSDRTAQASAPSSVAQVHQLRKEYSAAIKHYSEALQLHTDIGDRTGQAFALSNLARSASASK